MDTGDNLKYFAIIDYPSYEIMSEYSKKSSERKMNSKIVLDILTTIGNKSGMQVIPTEDTNCCIMVEGGKYAFACLSNPQFAQRFCRTVLTELKVAFYQQVPGAAEHAAKKEDIPSRLLSDFALKHSNPRDFDKVAEANNKIQEVSIKLQEELKKVAGEKEKLEDLELKSSEMSASAKGFEKSSADLEGMMKCRNYKLCFIIGCVVVAILLYIFVPIIKSAAS
eukprot:TRINITY_DN10689_c0_g1_i15.p1 TRINITY_DN10689_c0_g1~~TRINITY_DN10689_c0_g1_i15.p1  ORF type:complete len:223 (-),score=84.21 TRINITY_DN10689_c0_g1_i15:97-765(-)